MLSRRLVTWRENFQEAARAIFTEAQQVCFLCAAPVAEDRAYCNACEQSYFHPELMRCLHCGKLIPQAKTLCSDCREGRGPKELDQVAAWGYYSGAWRDFIRNVKFQSQPYLLKKIGKPLADWAVNALPPPHLIVPVPMHPERLAERGFNQAAAIASLLHWELGIPLREVLERSNLTLPQVGLGRHERLHNLQGAIRVSSPREEKWLCGRSVWIIDDVITTGATMEACALALRRAGGGKIFCLALAAGCEKGIV